MESTLSRIESQLIERIRVVNSKVNTALQCLATLSLKMEDRLPNGFRLISRWINRHRRRRSLMEFPVELQTEILVRMPVKSILLCKCVCKQFRNIIQSPNFIQTHLTRISDQTQSLLLRFGQDLFLVDNTSEDVLSSIHFTVEYEFHLVGSSNGLICFLVCYRETDADDWTDYIFLLWNPVINQSRYLPKSLCTSFPLAVEFAYVTDTNDYLIIQLNRASGFYVEVYKMSIDSWIMIECGMLAGLHENVYHESTSVFLNGSFHWYFYQVRCSYILYYKIKDEKLEVMKGVDDYRVLISNVLDQYNRCRIDRYLTVIDESLAWIFWNENVSNKLEIWVMNEYGVEDSWAVRYQIVDDISYHLSPLGYWTNGYLLIFPEIGGFDLYDLNTKRRMNIPKTETRGVPTFCSFVETLVPVKSLG